MNLWYDQDKISLKYGGHRPNTVDIDPSTCELAAQGRLIERSKRLRSTRMFAADIARCGGDIDKIIDISYGVCYETWRTHVDVKLLQYYKKQIESV